MSSGHLSDSPEGVRRAPVSLRGDTANRFLADHEITVRDGEVEPVEHEGRRYAFSHRLPADGYRAAGENDLYVFVLMPE